MSRRRVQEKKTRGWCITVNNITDADWELLRQKIPTKENVRYFCGQLEVGASGTRHLQACCEFSGPVGLRTVQRLFPRCHAEMRRGTPAEAAAYCKKTEGAVSGSAFEYGEIPRSRTRQGAREDLNAVREAIRGGATVSEILTNFPLEYAKYPRFVDKCFLMFSGRRNWKTEVRVYVGPTECGKTSSAFEEFPDLWVAPEGGWFDGYDGEEHVLLDDFNGGRECGITFRSLLRLLDRYRMVVAVKGAFVQWRPRVIIITTNHHPSTWFPWEDPAPLLRRIDVIKTWEQKK